MAVERQAIAAMPPWSLSLFRGGGSPLWVALALAVAYLAVFVAAMALSGHASLLSLRGAPWRNTFLWDNLVTALLVGYLPSITAWGVRGTLADLHDLRPALPGGETEFPAIVKRVFAFDLGRRRWLSVLVVPAALVWVSFFAYLHDGLAGFGGPSGVTKAWELGRVTLLGWLAYWAVSFEVAMMRAFGDLARERVRIDLFDLRPLAPFSHHGLRTALLWIVFFCFFSLFGLTDSSGYGDATTLTAILVFTAVGLFGPMLPIHRRIRARKDGELERLRAAIRAGLREEDAPQAAADRVAGLITLETRIASAPEWPFDALTLARFALYAAVGVGSWLGAALVERALEAMLG